MKFVSVCLVILSGCAVAPDKLILGADHVSHILQHFEHEPTVGGTVGCTGALVGLRWERNAWYAEASDAYCATGNTDRQREVANLQFGIAVGLKR